MILNSRSVTLIIKIFILFFVLSHIPEAWTQGNDDEDEVCLDESVNVPMNVVVNQAVPVVNAVVKSPVGVKPSAAIKPTESVKSSEEVKPAEEDVSAIPLQKVPPTTPEKEFKKTTVTKKLDGEVAGISADFIAIDCGLNEKKTAAREMAFKLDKNVKVEVKKSIKEIGVGDTVSVTYEEIAETNGKIIRNLGRTVKSVRFLRPAPKQPEPSELQSRAEV